MYYDTSFIFCDIFPMFRPNDGLLAKLVADINNNLNNY